MLKAARTWIHSAVHARRSPAVQDRRSPTTRTEIIGPVRGKRETSLFAHRPSPAMVVAVVALSFALAGSAIAGTEAVTRAKLDKKEKKQVKRIAKKQAKKQGKKQANKQIRRKAPGLSVASARNAVNAHSATNAQHAQNAVNAQKSVNAQNATNAQNAAAVNGNAVSEINYKVDSIAGNTTIFQGSGLTLHAACAAADNISIVATTSKADSSIYTTVVDTDVNNNNLNADSESGTFDPGVIFNLLAGSDGNPGLVTFEYDANDGSSVSGIIAVDEDNAVGDDCQAHGHVTAS